MGDDIVELSTENKSLKNKLSSHDEKWLEQSKAKLIKQICDGKRANFIVSKKQKQTKKTIKNGLH